MFTGKRQKNADFGGGQLVHSFQAVGGRIRNYNRQHDRLLVSKAPAIDRAFMRSLFHQADQSLRDTVDGRILRQSGTTATLAHIGTNNIITTANLGDSRATMFIRRKETGQIEGFPLTRDHSAHNAGERKRVQAQGGGIDDEGYLGPRQRNGEVQGQLAMTRCFGDTSLDKYISRAPVIRQYRTDDPSFGIKKGDDIFLCVETDGAHNDISASTRANAINIYLRKNKKTAENMMHFLAMQAIITGSQDNLSMIFTKLSQNRTENILLGAFDGHGTSGYIVSRAVQRIIKSAIPAPK